MSDKAEQRQRFEILPRRTRQLVEMLIVRADLTVVDVAGLLQMSVHNARKRLRCEVYAAWGLEGRTHLVAEYRDVVVPDATTDGDGSLG